MVQFSFILNLTIFLNYDIFDILCIFQLIDAAVDSFNSIVAKDGIVLNLSGLDGWTHCQHILRNGACNSGTWHFKLSSRVFVPLRRVMSLLITMEPIFL
jgi:hypothetical protein